MEFAKHAIDVDLVLGDDGLQLVALGLALASVSLVLERDVDCVVLIAVRVELIIILVRSGKGVRAVIKSRVALSVAAQSLLFLRALLFYFSQERGLFGVLVLLLHRVNRFVHLQVSLQGSGVRLSTGDGVVATCTKLRFLGRQWLR